jgi:hypothetical protein
MTMTNETTNQLVTLFEGVIATLKKVDDLETQVALANSQLRAMHEANNQLADIAFDENKFTQELLKRVEDLACETAKDIADDATDIDNLAHEVCNRIDITERVERVAESLDFVNGDKVNDLVEEYINDNNLLNTDEVEEVVSDYLETNDYQTESDVESLLENYLADNNFLNQDDVETVIDEKVNEVIDERTESVARRIAKQEIVKLIHEVLHAVVGTPQLIKENSHANNDRDTSIQVSGTNGQGEAGSYNAASA